MELTIAILLFFMNVTDDVLVVLFTRRVVSGKAAQAAILSGILTFMVAISVIYYVENRWYLIPIVSGSVIGTFYAIKMDKYLKKKSRKRKGGKKNEKSNPRSLSEVS